MIRTSSDEKYKANSTALEIMGIQSIIRKILDKHAGDEEVHSAHFIQEPQGVLVFDSRAKVSLYPISHTPDVSESPSGEITSKDLNTYYVRDKSLYLKMDRVSKSKEVREDYVVVVPSSALYFSSAFESGNLQKAVKISENEYDLSLEFDTNTESFTQWYYFSVQNHSSNHTVKFNIKNFMKKDSLYNKGLKPFDFSVKRERKTGKKWENFAFDVSYKKGEPRSRGNFHTLSFTYTFEFPEDIVYFAYSIPYTYKNLMSDISHYSSLASMVRVETLCQTISGQVCPLILITNNIETYKENVHENLRSTLKNMRKNKKNGELLGKKAIFLSARVHPGETVGSYMLKGAIEFLLGPSREANFLRDKCIFYIIPMLNPDGVIQGNYRCSLLGVDLNRRWMYPHRILHPTIYYAKKLLKMVGEERDILCFCDFHGHSIKKDVFAYGCAVTSSHLVTLKNNLEAKLLPFVASMKNNMFSFPRSRFRLEKSKQHTARIVVYREAKIVKSYTIEGTFNGPSDLSVSQMDECHYLAVGKDVAKSFLTFIVPSLYKSRMMSLLNYLKNSSVEEMIQEEDIELEENWDLIENWQTEKLPQLIQDSDITQTLGKIDDDSAGSESEPSEDEQQIFPSIHKPRTVKDPLSRHESKDSIKREKKKTNASIVQLYKNVERKTRLNEKPPFPRHQIKQEKASNGESRNITPGKHMLVNRDKRAVHSRHLKTAGGHRSLPPSVKNEGSTFKIVSYNPDTIALVNPIRNFDRSKKTQKAPYRIYKNFISKFK